MIDTCTGSFPGLTVLTARGPLTTEEVCQAAVAFVRDAPSELALWDFTQADFSSLPTGGVGEVFDVVFPFVENRMGGRSALVFNSTVGFGLGRMAEALGDLRDYPCEIRAFWDTDDALRWLRSGQVENEEGEGVA